jgi:hypothetical protein
MERWFHTQPIDVIVLQCEMGYEQDETQQQLRLQYVETHADEQALETLLPLLACMCGRTGGTGKPYRFWFYGKWWLFLLLHGVQLLCWLFFC